MLTCAHMAPTASEEAEAGDELYDLIAQDEWRQSATHVDRLLRLRRSSHADCVAPRLVADSLSHELSRDVVTALVDERSHRCGPAPSS